MQIPNTCSLATILNHKLGSVHENYEVAEYTAILIRPLAADAKFLLFECMKGGKPHHTRRGFQISRPRLLRFRF